MYMFIVVHTRAVSGAASRFLYTPYVYIHVQYMIFYEYGSCYPPTMHRWMSHWYLQDALIPFQLLWFFTGLNSATTRRYWLHVVHWLPGVKFKNFPSTFQYLKNCCSKNVPLAFENTFHLHSSDMKIIYLRNIVLFARFSNKNSHNTFDIPSIQALIYWYSM